MRKQDQSRRHGRRGNLARRSILRAIHAPLERLESRTMLAVQTSPSFAQLSSMNSAQLSDQGVVRYLWNNQVAFAEQGEWIVKLKVSGDASARVASAQKILSDAAGATIESTRDLGGNGLFLVQTPNDLSLSALQNKLDDVSGFGYVEPNFRLWANSLIPNDPQFSSLYGLHNTGQSSGKVDADIDAPEAWDITTGSSSVVVGVIDTGIDYNHPDLAANVWTNPGEIAGNRIDDDGNGFVDDIHGYDFVNNDGDPMDDHYHGTHVSGTIGAVGNNNLGVVGVAWNVKIMGIKFLSASGSGSTANAIAAVNYATTMRNRGVNIRLTSNSWGGGPFDTALQTAIEASGNAGLLFVAAAGNDYANNDTSPHYPASYTSANIISVAATDRNDTLASFSNYGLTTVDLSAPGVDTLSTSPGNSYRTLSGTSMATPHVSGVAALAFSISPNASWQTIRNAIFAGVDPIAAMTGKSVTGGRLNAVKTLQSLGLQVASSTPAAGATVSSPPTDFTVVFGQDYQVASLGAADLQVNGIAATSVTAVNGATASFHFNTSPVTAQGQQTMTIAANAVLRQVDGIGNMAWSTTFQYDVLPMTFTTLPANGAVVQLPLTTLRVDFNEPYKASSITTDDLTISQGTVTATTLIDADTVEYTLSGIISEGVFTYSFADGKVQDSYGNWMAAAGGTLNLDIGTLPLPAGTFAPKNPLGSLVYQGSISGTLTAGDTDSFTVNLNGGQRLTALIDAASTLKAVLEIRDPSNNLLGAATASGNGKDALVQSVPVSSAGTYTITVSGAAGTSGAFTLGVTLNASLEEEDHDGAGDDTPATAQNLDGAFVQLGNTSGSRAAVIGSVPSAAGLPIYTENWESGTIGGAWSTYKSTAEGRIQVTGAYGTGGGSFALIMDNGSDSGSYVLNEAIWTVNLAGRTAASLTFQHAAFGDENESFGGSFTGHYNADGVAISADGNTWYPLFSADAPATWTTRTFDLAAAAASAGIAFNSSFKIKFQQYDNYAMGTDGRGFDNISITVPAGTSADYYSFTAAAGQRVSATITAQSGSAALSLRLLDSNGNTLVSGATGKSNVSTYTADYIAPAAGTYYFVTDTPSGADYSLVVTRGASFDLEPNGTVAQPQPLGTSELAYGYLENGAASGVEPDNFPSGTTITNLVPGITLSVQGESSNVTALSSSYHSTGTNVFGHGSTDYWYSDGNWLRADFTGGASTVSIDIVPDDSYDPGVMRAYNSAGVLLQEITSPAPALGSYATITITRPTSDIAYILASGVAGDTCYLDHLVVGGMGTGSDYYSVSLQAGGVLNLKTLTPSDGAGEFKNVLDPSIEVYNPAGVKVASNDNGAADGRNAALLFTAGAAGTYTIRVVGSSAVTGSALVGEYVLSASGAIVQLSLPANVQETLSQASGTVNVLPLPGSDLVISLTSSDPTRLSVPATVTVLAGQSSASIPITILDNSLLDGLEQVTITATAAGYASGAGTVTVHDDETATLTVSLPASAAEGAAPISGTVTASAAPTRDIVVQLASSNTARGSVPQTATILAGQTTANFTLTPVDNGLIDGSAPVTISANVDNWTAGSALIDIADNDATISIVLPNGAWEGQTLTATGIVQIGGTLTTPLVVDLLSSDLSELTLPASVTIPAGQLSAAFTLTFVNDGLKDGAQTVQISGSAAGLTGGSSAIVVHDAELDHLAFDPITTAKTGAVAFGVALRAMNIDNEVITAFNGSAALSASGQAGALPVTPATLPLVSGIFSGNVTINAVDPAVVLHASYGDLAADSDTFAVQPGAATHFQWGNIATPQIAGVPFNATITAKDANEFTATGFNGPVNLSGLIGTMTSQTMLGSATSSYSSSGTYTMGYAFTPSDNITVTHLRRYFGSKISIWSNTGTLLASQSVTGTNGTWTETALTTPITLQAGTTYRIGAYTTGTYYWRTDMPSTTPLGTITQSYYATSDAFPNSTNVSNWMFVDLRGDVSSQTSVPATPGSVTLVNGQWTGGVTVPQTALNMRLRVDDGASHSGQSNTFNVIQRTLSLILPADVRENDGEIDGLLTVSPAPAADLVVDLTNSKPGRLGIPQTITIPAGQTSVVLPITLLDNSILDGLETASLSASAATYSTATGTIKVHDDETTVISVSLPGSANEGDGSVTGTISVSSPSINDVVIQLNSSNPARATTPASVILPAGQTSVTFPLTLIDNSVVDGLSLLTVTASVENWISGHHSILISDNDNKLTVTLPASGWEGQSFSGAGTVTLGGTMTQDLLVDLTSSDAGVQLPASVVIPAGRTSVTFDVTLLDDGVSDGLQNVTVTASAAAALGGISGGNANIAVHDAQLDHFTFDTISGPKTAAVGFAVTARAWNIDNELLTLYTGSAALSADGQSGALTVTPASITFASGVGNANVAINAIDPDVTLELTSGAVTGLSNAFALQAGPVASFTWNTIGSTQYTNSPIAASVTARDANGYLVSNFNGTASLSAWAGAQTTSQTIFGSAPAPSNSYNNGTYTIGYSFTPSSNFTVTHVRSYAGTKVSIWTNTGALLTNRAVGGTVGTWTETSLSTPLQLSAGTTYRVGTYTAGQTYYGRFDMSNTSPIGTINAAYEISGDTFPTGASNWKWIFVDLRGTVGTATSTPISPTSATFVNGVWNGTFTLSQPASSVYVRVDDGAGHSSDSNSFNLLQRNLSLSLPTDATEQDGTSLSGTLSMSAAAAEDFVVTLTSANPARIGVPATVTIPAGQTSVSVPITVIDNNDLDGVESITITADAVGAVASSAAITLHDDETATLTVSLPGSATEGDAPVLGTITSSVAPTRDITISLASSDTTEATVPASITLKAGQLSANFDLSIVNDLLIDSTQTATITASGTNLTSGSASIDIQDNDANVTITLPTGGWEGQTLFFGGTVTIGGALPTEQVVFLSSSDVAEISLPAFVTIPAGQRSAMFNIVVRNDAVKDGAKEVLISAVAGIAGSASATMISHDSQPDHISFATISGPKTAGVPFNITASMMNIDNEVIQVYSGARVLSASGDAGSLPISTTAATFDSGSANVSVSVNAVDPAVVLNIDAGGGISADSNAFAVQAGALSAIHWGTIGPVQFAGVPFQASLTAVDSNGYTLTQYNGSATLAGWAGSAPVETSLLGTATANRSANTGIYTFGYSFTPSSDVNVTHIRSYFGTKVSIWTDNGTLLASTAVAGLAGSWTETALANPIELFAGVTYRIGAYTAGLPYYWRTDMSNVTPLGTINQSLFTAGDSCPASGSTTRWAFVDVKGTIAATGQIPVTPAVVNFTNGVWSGNLTIDQATTAMLIRAEIGAAIWSNTSLFDVEPGAPAAPVLMAVSDSGASNSDGITCLNNSAPGKTLQFLVNGTTAGATVRLYANGVLIGSATAAGGSTLVTTDGATALADGTVTITARQALGAGESPDSSGCDVQIDTSAPTVSAPTFEFETRQAVVFDVDADLVELSAGNIVLQNLTTGFSVPSASIGVTRTGVHYTVLFPGFDSGILPDGRYLLTIDAASARDLAGNALAADVTLPFHVLGGDANRDGVVDGMDLYILSANWKGSQKTFSTGDFNYDGVADKKDLTILAINWQKVLPPPPPAQPTQLPTAPRRTARLVSQIQ